MCMKNICSGAKKIHNIRRAKITPQLQANEMAMLKCLYTFYLFIERCELILTHGCRLCKVVNRPCPLFLNQSDMKFGIEETLLAM